MTRCFVLLLVLAALAVSYASSIRAWVNQRDQEQSLAAQISAEQQSIAQLQHTRARWNDPAFIEEEARLHFGWVLPGQRTFRVIGADGKVLGTPGTTLDDTLPPAATASEPWWTKSIESLQTAANPPAPKSSKTQQQPHRTPAKLITLPGQRGH